jgi:putative flippase GtrA
VKSVTFLKANVASLTGSIFDYLVTILLVSLFHIDPVIASTIGTICGGILNFLIGRNWVFVSKESKVHHQVFRYGLVWVGNLILNTGGMYVLTKMFKVHYVISKVFVSLIVGIGYNYVLQKKYVFKNN